MHISIMHVRPLFGNVRHKISSDRPFTGKSVGLPNLRPARDGLGRAPGGISTVPGLYVLPSRIQKGRGVARKVSTVRCLYADN